MRLRTLSLATLACLGLVAANGCPPQTIQETKLLASDGAAVDIFGESVSISGNVAVIGASGDDDNGNRSGAAYVFRFNGTSWVEEAKLLASDGAAEDGFGTSVSASGKVVLVGAYYDDDNGDLSGSTYVFRFNGTSWVEEAKLLASDGAYADQFGYQLSVADDVAVIGTTRHSAYVYRFDGANWVEEAKLVGADSIGYGASVSVSGDVALVGAHYEDDNGEYSGSAYLYRFDGTNWVEEVKLLASDGTAGDRFGKSVSVSDEVVVVGADRDSNIGHYDGSAYVFRFDGANWVEEAKLLASDGAVSDEFGYSVSVSGDVAVIGTASREPGSAYLYRFDGTNWVEEAKLLASDGGDTPPDPMGDLFGRSVSVSGDLAVVGAIGNDSDIGEDSGSAYVFSNLGGIPACGDGRDNDGDGLADLDDPGCAVALDTSEHSGLYVCDDGLDNDSDGFVDTADPACSSGNPYVPDPTAQREETQCQDGADNDGDTLIDFDGGLSALGYAATDPDPHCVNEPHRNCEAEYCGCGIGWELGPVLASLMLLARRRRCRRSA